VAVCVASAAATVAATSPPVGSMVGASTVAATAVGSLPSPPAGARWGTTSRLLWSRCEGPPALERRRFGSAGRSARVRLGPLLALRLVASLSRCLAGGGWLTLLSTLMK
jgi:hypothetical protein